MNHSPTSQDGHTQTGPVYVGNRKAIAALTAGRDVVMSPVTLYDGRPAVRVTVATPSPLASVTQPVRRAARTLRPASAPTYVTYVGPDGRSISAPIIKDPVLSRGQKWFITVAAGIAVLVFAVAQLLQAVAAAVAALVAAGSLIIGAAVVAALLMMAGGRGGGGTTNNVNIVAKRINRIRF